MRYGYAQYLREALPNATFVAFTGTPVSTEDKDTRAVFGDYVSVYDIEQAVKDAFAGCEKAQTIIASYKMCPVPAISALEMDKIHV